MAFREFFFAPLFAALLSGVTSAQTYDASAETRVASNYAGSMSDYSVSGVEGGVAVSSSELLDDGVVFERHFQSKATAFATASAGSLKATAYAFNSHQLLPTVEAFAAAQARVSDAVIIDAPGLTGKTGRLKVSASWGVSEFFAMTGAPVLNVSTGFYISVNNLRSASVNSKFFDTNGVMTPMAYYCPSSGVSRCDDVASPIVSLLVDFEFGKVFDLGMGLRVSLSGSGQTVIKRDDVVYNSFQYAIDAGHSGYWGGIEFVEADGVRLDDFSVVSRSGFDWRKSYVPEDFNPSFSYAPMPSVPEPSAFLTFFFGVMSLRFLVKCRNN